MVRDITLNKSCSRTFFRHALRASILYKYNHVLPLSYVMRHNISAKNGKIFANSFSIILGDCNQYLAIFLGLYARYCPILPEEIGARPRPIYVFLQGYIMHHRVISRTNWGYIMHLKVMTFIS